METPTSQNQFIHAPLGPVFAKTALPIIFVMGMNGVLTLADALFLGHFVGPDALAAVTLMFPIYMLVVAFATLVSNGMSSLLARALGAENFNKARAIFSGAHGLAIAMCVCLITLFLVLGDALALRAADGQKHLADMGLTYIGITILFSPILFVLSVHSDALRNEGRTGFMAAMSLCVSLANIGFNYILIALLEMGVAGSAYGTVLAQLLTLGIIFWFRLFGQTPLRLMDVPKQKFYAHWRSILALGAPQSLSFIGISLGAAAIITTLQLLDVSEYDAIVSAYGIITRVLTFAFLPLLGLSFAAQTIVGNNYGAQLWQRTNASFMLSTVLALIYCGLVQLGVSIFSYEIGAAFVSDELVISHVGRILPIISAGFFLAGPMMMVATYFQAIGDAAKAAILSLTKPYLFAIPLTFALAYGAGEIGIWVAAPTAEIMLLILTLIILYRRAVREKLRFGILHRANEVPA